MAYEFTRKTDNVDDVMAVDVNELQEALEAHEFLTLKAATELTIADGEITVIQACHKIQPQSGTADDLDTISGMDTGDLLILYVADAGTDTITIKHGTGNISCAGGADIDLSEGAIICYYDGTTVYISGGGGGGGASPLTTKGDLYTYDSADARLPVGADDTIPIADSGETVGIRWGNQTMTLIADAELGSDTANFDFTSIPATFKHLRLICSLRSDNAANSDTLNIRFNNVSTNTYYSIYYTIYHNATLSTAENIAGNRIVITGTNGNASPANSFAPADIYIPNYANANINKVAYASAGTFFNTTSANIHIRNGIGVSDNVAAISRITVFPGTGSNWKRYSRISLYGMN